MVVDLERQTVLHVDDDRTAETLVSYFDGLSIDDRLAIAMDMWHPHRKTVRDTVPDSDQKIVFDRFHVIRFVTEAMDRSGDGRTARSTSVATSG
jgi:transposase